MGKEFDNILDKCLEQLLVEGETLEQCLQSYPEQAVELKPLLEMASGIKKATDIQADAGFRASARYQFISALDEMASKKKSRPAFGWFPRWATVLTMVLGVLLVGSGTVAAAGYSMPDSPLYPVKLTTEQVQINLTPSTIGKAELLVKLADKRVAEIIYLAKKGDAGQIEVIAQGLDSRLVTLAGLVSKLKAKDMTEALAPVLAPVPAEQAEAPKLLAPAPAAPEQAADEAPAPPGQARGKGKATHGKPDRQTELETAVMNNAASNAAVLRAVLENAPESAKPALLRAIAVSETGYKKALESLDQP